MSSTRTEKFFIVQVAALGYDLVRQYPEIGAGAGLEFHPLGPVFPAVTCTAQAGLRTGLPPAETGIVCNGRFDRLARKTDFWNQSAALVRGSRIWAGLRRRGGTVGMLFWQQSLGEDLDLVLSPAPIHKHHGGMIEDCYAEPDSLYTDLCRSLKRPFRLRSYWGPLASAASSRWITDAACAVMTDRERAPDLLLAYLPHLDYVLQKFGPGVGDLLRRETAVLGDMLRQLVATAAEAGYRLVVWGDYAITAAERPVLLNRVLRQEGFFHVRRVGRRTYPDLYRSRAFAMVDHQIAHVFVSNAADLSAVRNCLAAVSGVDRVEPGAALIGHPESGDLVAVAAPGAWFAYPWWDAPREAPDYATHVDIHNKIGFDPCELFWGIPGLSISLDPGRVRGTHGRDDAPAALAAPAFDDPLPETTLELGARLRELLG